MTTDNVEYKGLYHKYTITNETYTGATWNESTSKKLIPLIRIVETVRTYNKIKTRNILKTPDAIIPYKPTITSEDIAQGFIYRYFLKKSNELVYFEISKTQYESYRTKLDSILYAAGSLRWQITGPIQSTQTPVKKPGVAEMNTNAIKELEKQLPGISNFLTNPLQFYTDTDFIVPRDINLG
jgi:hypothetical protein